MEIETKQLLENISNTWKLEARQENEELFYYINEVKDLTKGDKCYVIGRKGMGKTAISEYFFNLKRPDTFSERMSFKTFPFNLLYELSNSSYTAPNQYITIWKYLIYNAVCKMMAKNESVDSELQDSLRKIYPSEPIKALDRLVKKWTATGFGAEILGCGGQLEGTVYSENLSWTEKTDIFEEVIERYCNDDSQYYILIDELDEDYRDFEEEKDRKTYLNLITSLFKAVQDIRGYFKDTNVKIKPIVFLRSDIFSLVRDSDKNKWSEYIINLTWKPDELYKMICHRLFISSNNKVGEDIVWNIIVPQKFVYMGNKGHNKMYPFDYITRSTHWRPRDYINYIRECANVALRNNENVILSKTIKEVDKGFSEYLKREVTDEIFAVIPDIDTVFSIISQIRKQTFSPSDFIKKYCKTTGKSQQDARYVLRQLFEHSVIGNQPSMKGQQIFKYQYPDTLFNFNENMIIHRGLYKALQIF